jgi:antitoxin component YwqK of YwqJK toxin-antitoxin module
MKNTILILISLLVFTGCWEGKEDPYLVDDWNGIKYEVNSEVGYTGKYVKWYYHEDGPKEYEGNYKDGKPEGRHTAWYVKWYYYVTGPKKYEVIYKDGKKEGLYTEWYKNGQKKLEGNYKGGELEGRHTAWYSSSRKKSQRKIFEGNYKGGEPIGLHTHWYNNGQKSWEGIYTGQKSYEGNFFTGLSIIDEVQKWDKDGKKIPRSKW